MRLTQRALAKYLLGRGADYLFTVKGNQPTLHDDIRLLLDEHLDGLATRRRNLVPASHLHGKEDWTIEATHHILDWSFDEDRSRIRTVDPAAALRYRSHQGARARPRRGHAGQEPAPRPRLSENDSPATSARLSPSGPRPSPRRHTRGRERSCPDDAVLSKESAIRRHERSQIRHRAASSANTGRCPMIECCES